MHYGGDRFKVEHITGKMLEATKRGMAWDLLLTKKIRRSVRFCRVRIFFKTH